LCQTEACPNGIGLGGREHCQALFLDKSFAHGHSVSCDTYGSPGLAGVETFKVARVECWLVDPDRVTGAATVRLTDLVLDRLAGEQDLRHSRSTAIHDMPNQVAASV